MNTIDPIDIAQSDEYDLEEIFGMVALSTFNTTYPDEEVPKDSISIGRVYTNKKQYSCQVKFKGNNVICMINYEVEPRRFISRFYRLESEEECLYGIVNNKDTGFLSMKPNIFKGDN